MTTHKKRPTEFHEGENAARRFETTMQQLLRVSKEELIKREAVGRKKSRRPRAKV